jgi:putative peptidoglycan lipid II flippase
MVKKIIGFMSKEIKGLHEAAYLLAFFALFSQLLGLLRDRLLAGNLGTSAVLDLYYASFRIPDLLYVLVTFIVSGSILIPIFSNYLDDKVELKKIIDSIFTVFIFISITLSLIVFIFSSQILSLVFPGFVGTEYFDLLNLFTRILILSPLLLGISQLFGGIVQSYKRFFIYAISPILYNFGIIFGLLFLYPKLGPLGLILGVVAGIFMHLLIQIPFLIKTGVFPKITFNLEKQIIKRIFILAIPRSIALTSSQITMLVLISISSIMTAGSISIFNLAYNLQSVPMSIIGVSYSLAAFPVLSKLFSDGEVDKFLAKIVLSAKHIIFWSIPVITLFIILRAQIVRTILGTGQFTWNDTRLVAATLAMFVISVWAQSLILLFIRGYYAMGNTKKPLLINLVSTAITLVLAFTLYYLFKNSIDFEYFLEKILRISDSHGSEVVLLAFAFSLGMIINCLWLWFSFEKDFKGFTSQIKKTISNSVISSIVLAFITYNSLQFFEKFFDLKTGWGIFLQGFLSGILGILGAVIMLWFIKNQELIDVIRVLRKKIWFAKPVAEGQKEL